MAVVPSALGHGDARLAGTAATAPSGRLARIVRVVGGWARPAILWAVPRGEGASALPRRRGRARAALSDQERFEDLYFRSAQRALVFLTRRTADPEIAADLWGETWARAYEARDRYRGSSAAEEEGWLFGIARNVLAAYYKRGHAERRAMHRLGLERPTLDDDDMRELERLAGLDELRNLLEEVLRGLSSDQRQALSLRVIRGLAYEEVAQVMGVSEQTARARVSRGLRALGNALEGADIDLTVAESS